MKEACSRSGTQCQEGFLATSGPLEIEADTGESNLTLSRKCRPGSISRLDLDYPGLEIDRVAIPTLTNGEAPTKTHGLMSICQYTWLASEAPGYC